MKYDRICSNCEREFEASRLDQIFCSVRCRNAFNNEANKEKLAPYKEIMDNLRKQDKILDGLWKYNVDVLFEKNKLRTFQIKPSNARQVVMDANNKIKN
ncbi:MAG: hypothetical protein JWQ09_209 [Segetibacter sp.]|nr:hypothetical protein [Segetibacter sp.]